MKQAPSPAAKLPAAKLPAAKLPAANRLLRMFAPLWYSPRPLLVFSAIMILLGVFFALGIVVDSRMITGIPAWLKPFKFVISITIYTLTMAWLLTFVRTDKIWKRRFVTVTTWLIVVTFALEIIPIGLQAMRGTTSHYNVSSSFDTFWWTVMALAIMVLWFTNFAIAGVLWFERFDSLVVAWSVRLGLIICIIGMGLGYLMTSPSAQQMANWQAGGEINIIGAHSVGVPDGGAGLPFVNWSTEGGDLRIGHFVGMHALQVLPLLGWFLERRRTSQTQNRAQRRASSARAYVERVFIAAISYLAITLLVTWQALRAQPLIAPDSLTLTVFTGIIILTLAAYLWTLRPHTNHPHALSAEQRN
jgi:hypothetical protein